MAIVFKGRRRKVTLPPVPPELKQHAINWHACDKCELAQMRTSVALYRGDVPCDILMVGEAPGEAEDSFGEPFTGPAGNFLETLIEDIRTDYKPRIGITNIVACFPHTLDDSGKKAIRQPPALCVKACRPRLEELIRLVEPRMFVALGVPANKQLQRMKLPLLHPCLALMHPAAIMRQEASTQEIEIKRFIEQLYAFLEKYL
jgi:uracil-DNA glycosylase family 4